MVAGFSFKVAAKCPFSELITAPESRRKRPSWPLILADRMGLRPSIFTLSGWVFSEQAAEAGEGRKQGRGRAQDADPETMIHPTPPEVGGSSAPP